MDLQLSSNIEEDQMRPLKKPYVRSTPDQRLEAIIRLQSGDSFAEISRTFGFGEQAVYYWYKQNLRDEITMRRAFRAVDESEADSADEVELEEDPRCLRKCSEKGRLMKLVFHNPELTLQAAVNRAQYPHGIAEAKRLLRSFGIHFHTDRCLYPENDNMYHPIFGYKMFQCQPIDLYDIIYAKK